MIDYSLNYINLEMENDRVQYSPADLEVEFRQCSIGNLHNELSRSSLR